MGLLRTHLAATAIVVGAVAVLGAVFAFARPQSHPHVMPPPPSDGLSYTKVRYSAADARRAFARQNVVLRPGAESNAIADLHTASPLLEVAVFGDRKVVDASGFSNYYTFVDGKYVLAPRACGHGARNAERWRGNVRAIVSCGPGAAAMLRKVDAAFASLR